MPNILSLFSPSAQASGEKKSLPGASGKKSSKPLPGLPGEGSDPMAPEKSGRKKKSSFLDHLLAHGELASSVLPAVPPASPGETPPSNFSGKKGKGNEPSSVPSGKMIARGSGPSTQSMVRPSVGDPAPPLMAASEVSAPVLPSSGQKGSSHGPEMKSPLSSIKGTSSAPLKPSLEELPSTERPGSSSALFAPSAKAPEKSLPAISTKPFGAGLANGAPKTAGSVKPVLMTPAPLAESGDRSLRLDASVRTPVSPGQSGPSRVGQKGKPPAPKGGDVGGSGATTAPSGGLLSLDSPEALSGRRQGQDRREGSGERGVRKAESSGQRQIGEDSLADERPGPLLAGVASSGEGQGHDQPRDGDSVQEVPVLQNAGLASGGILPEMAGTGQETSSLPSPSIDKRELLSGVTRAARHGGGEVSLHVHPPALGPIRIHVQVDPKTKEVDVRLVARDESIGELLRGKTEDLKGALSREGFTMHHFHVETVGGDRSVTAGSPGQSPGFSPGDGGSSGSGTQSGDGGTLLPTGSGGGFLPSGAGGEGTRNRQESAGVPEHLTPSSEESLSGMLPRERSTGDPEGFHRVV